MNNLQKEQIAKNKREYYILAGIKGMKEKLEEADLDLSPTAFMIIDCDSGIGKLIEEEAKRRVKEIKK